MAKRLFRIRDEPLLDIVSYGRGGPHESGGRLLPAQVEQMRRTVQRVPEVMVKVLSHGAHDVRAAARHLDYISRNGTLALETDDADQLRGQSGRSLLDDWDLALDEVRRGAGLSPTMNRCAPKLIHKLMFSMPAGTPPEKVREAVRNLAREQFAFQHRYAFVLHTDEPHPHVHLVMKAVSEQGVRLNISKATLRHWRAEFAQHLRLLGVAANATERAVRGESRSTRRDGIYRASVRGDSTYVRAQTEAVACELLKGDIRVESGKASLVETRRQVTQGWLQAARRLSQGGMPELADEVREFVRGMSPPRTDREWIAEVLLRDAQATRKPSMERSR